MLTEIFIPKMGANIERVTIGKMRVKEGDRVKKGDILFDIVTDKATFEVEADAEGTVLKLECKEGEDLDVLKVVGYIGEKGDILPELKSEVKTSETQTHEDQVKATPRARKMAKENNIDINAVFAGSDKIVKEEDILELIKPKNSGGDYIISKFSSRKKAEITALAQTKSYLYSSVTVQVPTTKIKDKVAKIADKNSIRLSLGQYLYHCAASILPDFPDINAFYTDEGVARYKDVNLGIAMNPDEGLIVPVIKNADKIDIVEFSSRFNELAFKVIKNEMSGADVQGGTFTITDLSSYKVFDFSPMVNKDQSAILGISSEFDSVTHEKGKLNYDPKINLTLAFDHRVMDGKYAALFLRKLVEVLTPST